MRAEYKCGFVLLALLLCIPGAMDGGASLFARSQTGWHSPARRCCAEERLTAGPAAAASRQHPGNRRRSHEPGFPAQFISQPFWSPPCSLRTANPGGTRCPGCAGRGDQRSHLGTPGHRLSARPLFFFTFLGSAPEQDIIFASAASFFFFLYFLPVFPCCLWCRSQVFCGC